MATSKTSSTYNRQSWEDAEFPILCQTCLGDNPYIRMTKEKYGKECKICVRPFTVFRWCPGARMRFKKTEVCQTCARLKNVCQTCLLDLEYGLPIQVRDAALKIKDDIPKSDVNKEYYIQNMDHKIGKIDGTTPAGSVGKAQGSAELLMKLARSTPYYKRNRPHICSFWVKGKCRRGEECPYRHEKPTDPDDPLADQNIKDRYYGVNDPVAEKLMARASTMPKLEPPEDKTITTLYAGNLGDKLTEEDLRTMKPSMHISIEENKPSSVIVLEKHHSSGDNQNYKYQSSGDHQNYHGEENSKENSNPKSESNQCKVEPIPEEQEEDRTPIMPWRSQLRKTNSTLNLLE